MTKTLKTRRKSGRAALRRRGLVITEFQVEVYRDRIQWNGLDVFLLWLLRKKPKEGFRPYAWKISRINRHRQSSIEECSNAATRCASDASRPFLGLASIGKLL